MQNYDFIENEYIKKYYPKYSILRTLVLYGSNEEELAEQEVKIGFLLNVRGKMILGIQAPKLFIQSLNNLLRFWNQQ